MIAVEQALLEADDGDDERMELSGSGGGGWIWDAVRS